MSPPPESHSAWSVAVGGRTLVRAPSIARPDLLAAALTLGAFLTLLLPFLCAPTPPLVDYPNHMARYWLLAGGVRDPAMSQVFRIDWANASTNVGVDRMVALLAPVVPGLVVGRFAMVLAALLLPIGLLALNTAVFGRRSAWQALFPIAAWSAPFLMGFLNFQVGLGLALLAAAADAALRPRLGRAILGLRFIFGAILLVDHPFALLFFALLVAALEFGPEPAEEGTWPRLWRAALASVWCLTPIAVLLAAAKALPAVANTDATGFSFGGLDTRLAFLLSPLVGYNVLVELPLAVGLGYFVLWLAGRGKLRAHAGLMIAAAIALTLGAVFPNHVGDSSWINARFPIMALLGLLAGVQLARTTSPKAQEAFAMAALAFVAARAGWIAWNWHEAQPDIAAVRRVIADLPVGASVMPVQHRPTTLGRFLAPAGRYIFNVRDPTFRHDALLAIPLKQAHVPTLFALHGKQPIQVQAPWSRCAATDGGGLPSVNVLANRGRQHDDPAFAGRWRQCFSYVLVMNADLPDSAGPFRPPADLQLVADQGFAQLWRVRPASYATEGR